MYHQWFTVVTIALVWLDLQNIWMNGMLSRLQVHFWSNCKIHVSRESDVDSDQRRGEMRCIEFFFVTIAPGVPLLPLKPWSPAGPLFPEAPGGPGSPWKPHIHTYVIRCKASSQQTAGPYAVINHSSQQVTQRRNTYILWAIIHLTLWSFLPLFISKLEDRMRPRR